MPDTWGASGGRLVLTLDVQIVSDRLLLKEEDPMLKQKPFLLKPVSSRATYITNQGQQTCTFAEEGGWKIRFPPSEGPNGGSSSGKKGHASSLRCFLDLKTPIQRNDISLPAPERIYFSAKCWREDEVERAYKRLKPIQDAFSMAQRKLDQALAHETGDRRLDGNDLIGTLAGMRDTAQLVLDRDEALRNLEQAKAWYPTMAENDLPEGPWPGQIEWLSMEPRFLVVRRPSKNLIFGGDEFHVIGTWKAAPILDDEEYADDPSIF
jgi:hypothetical protein